MKPVKLTAKQEAFCLAYLETGNASEAYRQVYKSDRMKPATIARKAHDLMENGKIAARLTELRVPIMERHNVTVDSLLLELEEARQLALQTEQTSTAVSATMGKAKLCGLDKQIIETTHRVVDDGSNEW